MKPSYFDDFHVDQEFITKARTVTEADLLTNALIKEEFCRAVAGFGMSVNMCTTNFCYLISRYGTEEQKKKYIPPVIQGAAVAAFCLTEPEAGSDALSIKTAYRKEGYGYILNGSKTFITNAPIAQYFMMVSRKHGTTGATGGTLFILERSMEGIWSKGQRTEKTYSIARAAIPFLFQIEEIIGHVNPGSVGLLYSEGIICDEKPHDVCRSFPHLIELGIPVIFFNRHF